MNAQMDRQMEKGRWMEKDGWTEGRWIQKGRWVERGGCRSMRNPWALTSGGRAEPTPSPLLPSKWVRSPSASCRKKRRCFGFSLGAEKLFYTRRGCIPQIPLLQHHSSNHPKSISEALARL